MPENGALEGRGVESGENDSRQIKQRLYLPPAADHAGRMFKWFLGAGAVGLLVVFVIWQRNSVKTTYVNGLASYSALPNQQFLIEHDCYVFKLKDHNTSWPLIGARLTVPSLPAEVEEKNIGAELPDVRILEVIRSGTRFKIISVRQDKSRKETFVTFEILILSTPEQKYPRLDAFYLLDHSPEKNGAAPAFLESYAVPRVAR